MQLQNRTPHQIVVLAGQSNKTEPELNAILEPEESIDILARWDEVIIQEAINNNETKQEREE